MIIITIYKSIYTTINKYYLSKNEIKTQGLEKKNTWVVGRRFGRRLDADCDDHGWGSSGLVVGVLAGDDRARVPWLLPSFLTFSLFALLPLFCRVSFV